MSSRRPELGRVLLLSPVEFFGQFQARLGPKLSLLFHLTGFPYLSGTLQEISKSLQHMMARRAVESEQSGDAKKAMADWAAANGRQVQDLAVAAILETARRNEPLRLLVKSDLPVTPVRVAQSVPKYEALDWKPVEDLIQFLEPFLARPRSKKPINRFTLNYTALLRHMEPNISQQDVVFRSAQHFVGLLGKRGVSEADWRNLLLLLIDRELVAPYTSLFLWCRKFPEEGFVASSSLLFGALPPLCPSCGKEAHAMGSFAPGGPLRDAMNLKDGILGAAVGWHLTRRAIRFWHSRCEKGTEMDFIPIVGKDHLLIECKVLSVSVSAKQLARTIRDCLNQLDDHLTLLEQQGWRMRGSACVVNLTEADIESLQRSGFPIGATGDRLVSYERFSKWLHTVTK